MGGVGVEWSRFGSEVKTVTCSAPQKLINTVYTFFSLFFFCVFEGYTSYGLDDNYPRSTESHHHQAYAEITYVCVHHHHHGGQILTSASSEWRRVHGANSREDESPANQRMMKEHGRIGRDSLAAVLSDDDGLRKGISSHQVP